MGVRVRRMRKTAIPLNPRPKPILSIKMVVLPPTMIPISPQSLNKPIIGNWDLVSTTIFKSQPGITILVLDILTVLQLITILSIGLTIWRSWLEEHVIVPTFPFHSRFSSSSLMSRHLSPRLSHHQPVQWSVSTLLSSLENLSPPLSHLTSDICSIHPNPTHSGIVDDHDSQAHLGHITTSSDSLPFKHV